FCSCSSIPIFMGLIEANVPLGVASSFLITSPLVNEYVVVLMLGFFGWEIATAYVIVGVALGTILGIAIGRMGMEGELVPDVFSRPEAEAGYGSFMDRVRFGYAEAKGIVRKLWVWIIAGVGMGAIVHGFVPEEAISALAESAGVLSVPIAVLVGIPIYANCSAIIPIAAVLFEKGAPLGTALAFMMATAALSLPEAVMLRRIMRIRLLLLFFGMVAFGIILIGYLFDIFF
ncbi:MAG: permease, partial [Candidatus Micrarchaeota archaeon]